MPRGPKGERRPADAIGNAVKVMRIATREEPDDRGRAVHFHCGRKAIVDDLPPLALDAFLHMASRSHVDVGPFD